MGRQNGLALGYAAERLRADAEIALVAVTQRRRAFFDVALELQSNREFCLAAIARDGLLLEYVPKVLQGDREIVFTAVTNSGLSLRYASPDLQGDSEIMLAAFAQDRDACWFTRGWSVWLHPRIAICIVADTFKGAIGAT